MRCPSCRADNPPGTTSCQECGDTIPGAVLSKTPALSYPIAHAQADDDVMDVLPAGQRRNSDDDDEYDPGDGGIGTLIPYRNPKALAAYYVGFFSLIPVAGLLAAPIAIVLGIMGLRAVRAKPEAKGTVHAWIGVVFGFLSLFCNSVFMLFFFVGPFAELRR